MNTFNRTVKAAQDRLKQLLERTGHPDADQQALVQEASEALANSLQELHVAQEELQAQNEELQAIQEQLETERQRYQELFAFAPDGYLVTDARGVIREANRAAADLLGVRRYHLEGNPLSRFVVKEERTAFYAQITRLRAGEANRAASWETQMQPQDDTSFHASLTNSPIYNEAGKLSGIRWLIRDVTARVKAEEAQRKSEERFATVMNSIETIMYVADMETYELLFVNQYTRRRFGNIEGQICWQALQEDQQGPCDFCTNAQLLDEGGAPTGVYTWEFQNTRTGRWYHIQDRAIRWIDGRWVRLEMATDVTELQRMEEALQKSETQYRQLAESAEAILWEYDVQSDRWTYVAPQVTRMLGYPPEAWADIQFWLDHLHPEDRTWARRYCLECTARGEPHTFEYRFLKKDGNMAWIRDVVSVEMQDGQPVKLRGFMLDITERKRMEEEIESERAFLAAVLDNIEEAVVICDEEGRITRFNATARQLHGLPERPIPPEQWAAYYDLYREDGTTPLPMEEIPLFRALQGERVHDAEIVVNPKDSEPRSLVCNGQTLVDESGQVTGAVVTMHDITARKAAEEALEQYAADLERSNQELERFGYVISHDLQEPARTVKSYLNLLAKRYQEQLDEKADTYVRYAVDAAERMQAMIQALLALSRVETRGGALTPSDIERVLAHARLALQYTIETNDAEISHDPLPTVPADAAQLTQVFQNLIANAIKFRREDVPPRVHVSAEQRDDEWVFAVADNGIGIDPAQADRIFHIFQRLHTREEYAGLGIGLALCKRIVERHGGRIWVASTPGEGATFKFTLPAAK